MNLNPLTNKEIHTPTVVEGERGLMEPLPGVFNMLQHIETILLLVESLCHDLLNKMKYILWVVALLEACDVTNNGRHLGFYQELEIRLKPREMVIFCALHEK